MQPTHPDQLNRYGAPHWRIAIMSHGIGSTSVRRKPTAERRRLILAEQDNKCLYCDFEFGQVVYRRGFRPYHVLLAWDHFRPYVLTQRSSNAEFVAACRICNGIKTCTIYSDIASAREDIQAKRKAKGYPANADESDGWNYSRPWHCWLCDRMTDWDSRCDHYEEGEL